MNKLINYQTISQNGKLAFIVISYNEFINILPELKASIKDDRIPHEVVRNMIQKDISRVPRLEGIFRLYSTRSCQKNAHYPSSDFLKWKQLAQNQEKLL